MSYLPFRYVLIEMELSTSGELPLLSPSSGVATSQPLFEEINPPGEPFHTYAECVPNIAKLANVSLNNDDDVEVENVLCKTEPSLAALSEVISAEPFCAAPNFQQQ